MLSGACGERRLNFQLPGWQRLSPSLRGPLLGPRGRRDLPLLSRRLRTQDSPPSALPPPSLLGCVGEMGYTVEFNQNS